mmetsp:Transcript_6690/g.11713  ORF Transcript_6690/g.11713 Transcript_6690/m.11713 type:complete len:210 (-) Transcript_6690:90-719(-)
MGKLLQLRRTRSLRTPSKAAPLCSRLREISLSWRPRLLQPWQPDQRRGRHPAQHLHQPWSRQGQNHQASLEIRLWEILVSLQKWASRASSACPEGVLLTWRSLAGLPKLALCPPPRWFLRHAVQGWRPSVAQVALCAIERPCCPAPPARVSKPLPHGRSRPSPGHQSNMPLPDQPWALPAPQPESRQERSCHPWALAGTHAPPGHPPNV